MNILFEIFNIKDLHKQYMEPNLSSTLLSTEILAHKRGNLNFNKEFII